MVWLAFEDCVYAWGILNILAGGDQADVSIAFRIPLKGAGHRETTVDMTPRSARRPTPSPLT